MVQLSILLPVKDYPLLPFVQTLAHGIENAGIEGEIVIGDDGSECTYSEQYHSFRHPLVRVIRPSRNLGRSRIRNLLGAEARGQWLLFADADATIPARPADFLEKYIHALKEHPVVCGGIRYSAEPPAGDAYYFRWYYGVRREEKPARIRNRNPHSGFSAFNFAISRELFLKNPFDEEIRMYGHEDTLFGMNLRVHGIPVFHIDNPLIHIGFETTRQYLKKSRTAVESLLEMEGKLSRHPGFYREIRLLKAAKRCRSWGLPFLMSKWFRMRRYKWEARLSGRNPSLRIYDLYRLSYYCYLIRNRRGHGGASRKVSPDQSL